MPDTAAVEMILSRLRGVRRHQEAGKWEAKCPAHEDRKPSLGVAVGDDGRVLLHCQAGCTTEAVVQSIGLTLADLYVRSDNGNGKPRIVATYDYQDEAGVLRYQSVRFAPKDFRQRRPDGKGGWIWNLKGVNRVLYRLPELLSAAVEESVFIVEGEKDVEALRRHGLVATTNAMGAGKWMKSYNEALRDRRVALLPDNDDAGRKHMEDVARQLHGIAGSVVTIELPGLPPKGDVSDWLSQGGTKQQLLEAVSSFRFPDGYIPGNVETETVTVEDATVADLIQAGATTKWAWPSWIPIGEMVVLASEPGVGKTRLCADLARRIYHGLPWPDGAAATFPAGARTLWVAADCQYRELTKLSTDFGIPPEAMYLNACKANPFAGTMLDSEDDLKDFETRIARIKPALVFVDTTLKATDRTAHKPEDAKAFFTPLQHIAQRTETPLVCVTHLNADGKPLGRRIEGAGRVVFMLERPDPEGAPDRRKLWVKKSHSLYPSPLGVTMGDKGNEYDDTPPASPSSGPAGGKGASRVQEAADWLREYLTAAPAKVHEVRNAAEEKGFSTKTLYKAKDQLPVSESEAESKKWWRLTTDED